MAVPGTLKNCMHWFHCHYSLLMHARNVSNILVKKCATSINETRESLGVRFPEEKAGSAVKEAHYILIFSHLEMEIGNHTRCSSLRDKGIDCLLWFSSHCLNALRKLCIVFAKSLLGLPQRASFKHTNVSVVLLEYSVSDQSNCALFQYKWRCVFL